MQIISLLLSLLALIAYYFSSNIETERSITNAVQLDSIAASIVIYQKHAATDTYQNPGYTGEIPASSLNLPNWYVIPPQIKNYATSGTVFVYYSDNRPGLPNILYKKTRARGVGIAKSGYLYTPQGNNSGRALPSQIIEGSLVYAQ